MRIRMNIGERNRRKVKMSKSSVLELAKKFVAAIEKEEQKRENAVSKLPKR